MTEIQSLFEFLRRERCIQRWGFTVETGPGFVGVNFGRWLSDFGVALIDGRLRVGRGVSVG